MFGATLASILVTEASVRVFDPQDLSGWWMVNHPSGLVVNRTAGTARHAFGDIAVEYSFGPHHNRKAVAAAEQADRLLLLGDSFAFGWLVADGLTFADRLQERLTSHEIINAAVGGWGTADHLKYLELFCSDLRPSFVYLLMNSFDIDRAVSTRLYRLDRDGMLRHDTGAARVGTKFVINQMPGYGWLLEHSHLAQLARRSLLATEPGDGGAPDASDGIALGRALFVELKAVADACGTTLRVFFTGWLQSQDAQATLTAPFVERALADGFFEQHAIFFEDLGRTAAMSALFPDRSRYTIPKDGHPNPAGAELLYRAVVEITAAAP